MVSFLSRPFYAIQRRDAAIQLIALCTAIFVIYTIADSGFHGAARFNALILQSDWKHNIEKPWSFITYAFVHPSFWGLLFNMVFLYFSSRLYYTFFSEKSLVTLFFIGVLSGSLSFQLAALTRLLPSHTLVGSSAGIYAVFTAICTYRPSFACYLFGAFRIELIYLFSALLLIDLIGLLQGVNTGGQIAHFGGVLSGFLYTQSIWRLPRHLSRLTPFKKFGRQASKNRSPIGVIPMAKTSAQRQKSQTENRLNEILDQISRSGYKSLSKSERHFLKETSKELNAES
ncbi:MAG: rhomboid family intramembrane serine protease [Flavobacteriales bacterium]